MDAQAELTQLETEFAALRAKKSLTRAQKMRAFHLSGQIDQAKLRVALASMRR